MEPLIEKPIAVNPNLVKKNKNKSIQFVCSRTHSTWLENYKSSSIVNQDDRRHYSHLRLARANKVMNTSTHTITKQYICHVIKQQW